MAGVGGAGAVGGAGMGAGAVGGMAAMGPAGIGAAQFSGVGGVVPTTIGGTQAAGAAGVNAQLQNLIHLMQGFSSSEILTALLLAGGSGGDNHHKKSVDSAMGFLIGMAMASQMPQLSIGGAGTIPGIETAGMTGMQLNVHA